MFESTSHILYIAALIKSVCIPLWKLASSSLFLDVDVLKPPTVIHAAFRSVTIYGT